LDIDVPVLFIDLLELPYTTLENSKPFSGCRQ